MFEGLLDWIAHHPQAAQWVLIAVVVLLALWAFRLVLSVTGRILLLILCLIATLGGSYLLVRIRQGRLTSHRMVRFRARVVRSSWKSTGRRCLVEVDVEHLALESVDWGCGRFEPDRSRLLPASCRLTLRCGRWVRSIESGGRCRFAVGTGQVTYSCSGCEPADSVTLDTKAGDLVYSENGDRIVLRLHRKDARQHRRARRSSSRGRSSGRAGRFARSTGQ